VVIKGLRSIILVKSIVIIYTVNPQYIPVARVTDVNCRCCNYKVQNGQSGAFFFLFFHLLLSTLFFLHLFLKLR